MLWQIGIVLALLAINGWFAMSELAVVSSRRARLEAMAAEGNRGAARALKLADDPGRFLSSVQIGITLVGILAGAYSGATLAGPLSAVLVDAGLSPGMAGPASIALVVGLITYASLIIGELVPKQIALSDPERIAAMVAGPMLMVARVASPLVTLLDWSSRLVLKVIRVKGAEQSTVTEEEIRAVIAEGTKTGVLEPQEREMLSGVMRFADRSIRGIMTPRRDVVGIDVAWNRDRIAATLDRSTHSRYPVYEGNIDSIIGIVQAKDMLDAVLDGRPIDVAMMMKPVQAVPDTAPALTVLDLLRKSPIHMVVVMDEFGSVEGIATAADILAAIVGDLASDTGEETPAIVRRADGSWLLDADLPVDLVADRLGSRELDDPERDYETLAGLILSVTKAIPTAGDAIDWRGWRFEVVDMDGRRIDKVLAMPPPSAEA